MELFYSQNIEGQLIVLDKEESGHLVRVLRHKAGDRINVIDGLGTMYDCVLKDDSPSRAVAVIQEAHRGWGEHPYKLTLAVCPTKNNDRYEWFAEKAAEMGIDEIVPVIGERSERKVFKTERLRKILVSAAKQSLKSRVPCVCEPVSVKDFILASKNADSLKLIAWCFENEDKRVSIREALEAYQGNNIIVMIGPEGDFSPNEAKLAVSAGFQPVILGNSRLRTETAALVSTAAIYYKFCL